MEQLFELSLEVEKDVNEDKIRQWLDGSLAGKVEFHIFLANHAGAFSGWGAIDGKLFIRNSAYVSEEDLVSYLGGSSPLVKSLSIYKASDE